jgi:hypothetical protein
LASAIRARLREGSYRRRAMFHASALPFASSELVPTFPFSERLSHSPMRPLNGQRHCLETASLSLRPRPFVSIVLAALVRSDFTLPSIWPFAETPTTAEPLPDQRQSRQRDLSSRCKGEARENTAPNPLFRRYIADDPPPIGALVSPIEAVAAYFLHLPKLVWLCLAVGRGSAHACANYC